MSEAKAEVHDDVRMLVQISVADMRALVREEVERAVTNTIARTPGRWVDVATAAEHCGCTQQTLRAWIKAGAPARDVGTPHARATG